MSRDTTPEAEEVQLRILRGMTDAQRSELGVKMSNEVRALALSGIRHRHPAYDDETAKWALFRMLVGDELFTRAWPQAPLIEP